MSIPDALVRCEGLEVGHRGSALLPRFDLEVRRGELLLALGRNGAGKTTWLQTMLGLIPPVSGRVVRAPGTTCAYFPQVSSLEASLPIRVRDVVQWGTQRRWTFLRPPARGERQRWAAAMQRAGVDAFSDSLWRNLSSGQRQRVFLARMLAADADALFLDEPTASMDSLTEDATFQELARLARDEHKAIVLVTHHWSKAMHVAQRVLLLDRDAALSAHGTPADIFRHPRFRATFVGAPDAR